MTYPKRLIEVDLPIKRISAHARREKDMRRGHIPLIHIWWATRPPAACRAVICAALWFDPVDENCPPRYRDVARGLMRKWGRDCRALMSAESYEHFEAVGKNPSSLNDDEVLRTLLLDFIADFANWDNSSRREYLETSRALTDAAHVAGGGEPGTRPLVVDPFAGGGAIPLEALRVGADAFASDLNPVAVLLNKVSLEYIPRYGQQLADEVSKWVARVKAEAEKELAAFYPQDPDGATPIAYLWARTVTCEGPGCGVQVPMIRSLLIAKRKNRSVALKLIPNHTHKKIDFEILENVRAQGNWQGTLKRGAVTCTYCGYTTPIASVRKQLISRQGGTKDARLYAVATVKPGQRGRFYRLPADRDLEAARKAASEIERQIAANNSKLSLVPDEKISLNEIRRINPPIYGMTRWGDLYTPRQQLAMATLIRIVHKVGGDLKGQENGLGEAVQTCLALMVDKMADMNCSLCVWQPHAEIPGHMFTRQAIPMVWDYVETNPLAGSSGSPESSGKRLVEGLAQLAAGNYAQGQISQASATSLLLPDDTANALITDPPYYDAVPYAYLSDFFYVLLRRSLSEIHPSLLVDIQVPKEAEIVVDRPHELSESKKDIEFYEAELGRAFSDGRRVVRPDGICTVVFASKTTASWEAVLKAVVDAGWIVTGSWAIDTEMQTRVAAQGQARLASSIHLVCRPRENADGSLRDDDVGDWRDVLRELPVRIHAWMPRLAKEGIVGADAIFACLGPALEIFSRYDRVEKASGDQVTLREYLEYIWAAVAKEALGMIFAGATDADVTGFEEDARLTAMWLWTLSSGGAPEVEGSHAEGSVEADEDEETSGKPAKSGGFILEYDAARKIAQGLGAHLEELTQLVEVKADKARLLSVAERTKYLFGQDEAEAPRMSAKKRDRQAKLFDALDDVEAGVGGWGEKSAPQLGDTVLDRVHQSMILFAAGRGDAMKRFLVDDGVGNDERFWRLANALSALYPSGGDEKRWVDGLLARKKGLGF